MAINRRIKREVGVGMCGEKTEKKNINTSSNESYWEWGKRGINLNQRA